MSVKGYWNQGGRKVQENVSLAKQMGDKPSDTVKNAKTK